MLPLNVPCSPSSLSSLSSPYNRLWDGEDGIKPDPFYIVKRQILDAKSRIERLEPRQPLLSSIVRDLRDLQKTVQIVERNRAAAVFTTITDAEMTERNNFIKQMSQWVRSLVKGNDEQQQQHTVANKLALEEHVEQRRATLQQVEEKQDQVLESMQESLERLKNMSTDIHSALDDSDRELTELTADVDEGNQRFRILDRRFVKLREKLRGCSHLYCICLLTLVMIALFLAVVWT